MSTNDTSTTISDDDKFVASITVAIPCFILFVSCFLFCRLRYPSVYMANQGKKKDIEAEKDGELKEVQESEVNAYIPDDGGGVLGMFNVIVELWQCDEKKIEKIAGFDAMVFTTLIWFQCKLLLILVPIGWLLLAPVYSAGNSSGGDFLNDIALTNVGSDDTWITTFTFLVALGIHVGSTKYLSKLYQRLSLKADKFNAKSTESHFTVMITDIEDKLVEGDELAKFLNDLYPGEVCNVDFCKDLGEVQKLWKDYKKAEEKREICEQSEKKTLGIGCLKKDLAHFQIVEADAKNAFYQTEIDNVPNIPVAMVQFEKVQTATSCASSVLVPGGHMMRVRPVPEFADQILWTNLGMKSTRKEMGSILGFALYLLLIIFYSPLMVFVQGVANLENLANMWSGFSAIVDLSSEVKSLIQGSLPAIIFSIFFMILPMYLTFLSGLCKMSFKTDEASLTLGRYADCLVGMGLLVSVFASGILSSVDSLNNLSPSEIWSTLGKEVPAQSVFFITYLVTAGFISLAMNMAMVVPFILNLLGMYAPTTFNYGTEYGVNIMMFTICVTYAVVTPMILIWGFFYFLMAYFTFTYQLIYVYKKSNDTGGSSFPSVYGRLNNGMVIGQLVIIAMLVLVESMVPAAIFLFVPFYTLSTKSDSYRYAYYFNTTSVRSAKEARSGIVIKGESNFIAPAVKALQAFQKDKGLQNLDDAGVTTTELKDEENPIEVSKETGATDNQKKEMIHKSDGNKEKPELKTAEPANGKVEMSEI